MDRPRLTTAVLALLLVVLVSLVASAMSGKPECCRDYHRWGNELENNGCPLPESSNDCDKWCRQSSCGRYRNSKDGFCKKIGKLHYCHCKC